MKRSPLRKQSKQKISVIQRKLWEVCRQIKLITEAHDGKIDCYTCDQKNLEGSNRQLGHMWAKAALGAYLKYDLRVLKWQCYSCNINRGGAGADFYKRMLEEIGEEKMTKLQKDRQVMVKAYDWYVKQLAEYTELLKHLSTCMP